MKSKRTTPIYLEIPIQTRCILLSGTRDNRPDRGDRILLAVLGIPRERSL